MGLGQLAYQVRSRFRHVLRTSYYREVVRPRILGAAGEWIQYLDAEDYRLPNKVARQGKLAKAEGLGVVCSQRVWRG